MVRAIFQQAGMSSLITPTQYLPLLEDRRGAEVLLRDEEWWSAYPALEDFQVDGAREVGAGGAGEVVS